MKVLLINPPYFNSKYKFIGLVAPPLGLAYIAAVLEDGGVNVKIIDAAALQMEWDVLEGEIKKYSPDVVAIGALTPTIEKALKTAKIAKNTVPNAKIVLGGYHPTFTYEEILKNEFIDIFPNPITSDNFSLEFALNQSGTTQIQLYNLQGMKVKDFASQLFNSGANYLDCEIENIPNGAYFIAITNNNRRIVSPIIIAR